MTRPSRASSSVSIGNISGGISDSMIAGGDITESTIRQDSGVQAEPSVDDVTSILKTLQTQLAELSAQRAALTSLSSSAPASVQGARDCIDSALSKLSLSNSPEQKRSAKDDVTEAGSMLSHLLEHTKTILEGVTQVEHLGQPIMGQLTPMLAHLSQAANWISQLWK